MSYYNRTTPWLLALVAAGAVPPVVPLFAVAVELPCAGLTWKSTLHAAESHDLVSFTSAVVRRGSCEHYSTPHYLFSVQSTGNSTRNRRSDRVLLSVMTASMQPSTFGAGLRLVLGSGIRQTTLRLSQSALAECRAVRPASAPRPEHISAACATQTRRDREDLHGNSWAPRAPRAPNLHQGLRSVCGEAGQVRVAPHLGPDSVKEVPAFGVSVKSVTHLPLYL